MNFFILSNLAHEAREMCSLLEAETNEELKTLRKRPAIKLQKTFSERNETKDLHLRLERYLAYNAWTYGVVVAHRTLNPATRVQSSVGPPFFASESYARHFEQYRLNPISN